MAGNLLLSLPRVFRVYYSAAAGATRGKVDTKQKGRTPVEEKCCSLLSS